MKPKLLLGLALVLSGGFNSSNIARCADVTSAIKVTIDIPDIWRDGKSAVPRQLENRYPNHDHFFVVIENISTNRIVIQNEDAMNRALHFEITDTTGKAAIVYRADKPDAKYAPYDLRLAPGEVTVREIYYGRDWENFPFVHNPHRANQTTKVVIRAVFEQKPSEAAVKLGYWSGKAISKPIEVLLEDNAL